MRLVPGNHGHSPQPLWVTPALTACNQASPPGTTPSPLRLPEPNHRLTSRCSSAPLPYLVLGLASASSYSWKILDTLLLPTPWQEREFGTESILKNIPWEGHRKTQIQLTPTPELSVECLKSSGPGFLLSRAGDLRAVLTVKWRTYETEPHRQSDAGAQHKRCSPS